MTTYREAVLASGPAYYWGFDGAPSPGGLTPDTVGGNPLTLSGTFGALVSPPLISTIDESQHAILFARANSNYAVSKNYMPLPGVVTLEAMVKTSINVPQYIIGFGSNSNIDRHVYINATGTVTTGAYPAQVIVVANGITPVTDGIPHHIACTINSQTRTMKVYIDGVLDGTKTWLSGTLVVGDSYVTVGRQYTYSIYSWPGAADPMYFDGSIDEPAVYLKELSSAEIANHARLALTPARLAGVAKLDTGKAADVVLLRAWDTHQHVKDVVPAADGAWSSPVPLGDFEVTVRGPAGYQPITHGPVTAVPSA